MAHRVTAGYVLVETGDDRLPTRIPGGSLLPDDVSKHQIAWELGLGTIEEVPDAASKDADEDEDEPDAKAEGDDADPDAGTPVDS